MSIGIDTIHKCNNKYMTVNNLPDQMRNEQNLDWMADYNLTDEMRRYHYVEWIQIA